MLILSRKSGESLQIGDNITLKAIKCHGKRVRLLIDAPYDVEIIRGELAELQEQGQGDPPKVDLSISTR